MKTLKYIIWLLIILQSSQLLISKEISGIVYGLDENGNKSPLIRANVWWLGSSVGTTTDSQGRFKLEKPSNINRLIASYTGYQRDTIAVDGTQSFVEINLISDLQIDGVDVYGRQPGLVVSRASMAQSERITFEGLRKAACCNLSESFVTNASVDVNYSDAVTGAKQIQLLGLEGTYTQMLTENIPNLRGIATTYGLSYIPGSWMESIQISKGAASVTSGYESITGQINVEYKKPEGGEPLFLNLYGNIEGRFEADLTSDLKLTEHFGTNLMLHANIFNQKWDHNNNGFLDAPMENQFSLLNRWEYFGDVVHSTLGIKLLNEERQAGQMKFYPSKDTAFYGINIKTNRYEVFGKTGYIMPTASYNSIALQYSGSMHEQKSFFGRRHYDAEQKSFNAKLLYETVIKHHHHHDHDCDDDDHDHNQSSSDEAPDEGPHKFVLGASFVFDEYNERLSGDTLIARTERVPGTFLEYTFSGIENLTITSGIRADFHNIHGTFITPRFHTRYQLGENAVLRASAGKGYHITNIIAENSGLLASSRQIFVEGELKPEEAWNYGINASFDLNLFNKLFQINTEFYRTDFINQVIVDLERNPGAVYFYNLDGKSYSNSFQIDVMFELFPRFDIMTAYRLNDVKMTVNSNLIDKPLVSRHKGFLNMAYATIFDEWKFDMTLEYSGSGSLPNTENNPEEFRLNKTFPAFFQLHGQITKKFDGWEVYLGGENLTNYRQPNPIIGHLNPFGEFFDSSMVWGPLMGRKLYLGIRLNLL